MENEYISADVSEKIKKRLKEFGTTAEQMLSELGMGKRTFKIIRLPCRRQIILLKLLIILIVLLITYWVEQMIQIVLH